MIRPDSVPANSVRIADHAEAHKQYGRVTTFDYWRLRLRPQRPSQPRLVKVEVARVQPASFRLHLANGRAIESSFAFAEDELVRLIRIAERA
jgi:hypothetical protein